MTDSNWVDIGPRRTIIDSRSAYIDAQMDKLQAMKTFVRVVEAGSFSAVAHESDATQSAVSKQVAALERELGAKLLTRTTRSLALTEEGTRYFEQGRVKSRPGRPPIPLAAPPASACPRH